MDNKELREMTDKILSNRIDDWDQLDEDQKEQTRQSFIGVATRLTLVWQDAMHILGNALRGPMQGLVNMYKNHPSFMDNNKRSLSGLPLRRKRAIWKLRVKD